MVLVQVKFQSLTLFGLLGSLLVDVGLKLHLNDLRSQVTLSIDFGEHDCNVNLKQYQLESIFKLTSSCFAEVRRLDNGLSQS